MRILSTLMAATFAFAAAGASAQTAHNPYDNGAEPFGNVGRVSAPALSSTTRSAVKAEYVRARQAGEVNAYDNHAQPFTLAELQGKGVSQQSAVAKK